MTGTVVDLPTFADVEAAAGRIAGVAHQTPVLTSRRLDEDLGFRLFIKAEHLQRAGAFKFRGAYNALSRFDAGQRQAGVVAFSSGNHAQAIALAARELGMPATVVMPTDAPASKIAATEGYGATVVLYDRYTEDREAIGRQLAEDQGLTLVPPYDHPDVIAGQGTALLELLDEVGELDAVLTPLGGGGLLSGTALAAARRIPDADIYGVEPEAGNDGQQSFRTGRIVRIETPRTIADGTQTLQLGHLTFPIIREHVTDILTVRDDALVAEMRAVAMTLKQVIEPTGVLALAGARSIREQLAGRRVGVIVSGGNLDLSRYADLLAG